MATCIHSSRSCLLPFYTIPIFPLLNRKIFHLLVYMYMYIVYTCMHSLGKENVLLTTQQDLSASSYAHLYWCRCHWKETAVQHRLRWGLSTNPTAVELVGYLRQEGSSRSGVEYTGVSGVLGGDWGVWRRLEKDVQVLSEHIYTCTHVISGQGYSVYTCTCTCIYMYMYMIHIQYIQCTCIRVKYMHMHVYTYTYNTFSGKMSAVFRGM